MTTEQKARAYDEALEKARKRVTIEPQDHTDVILKDIFPELKESDGYNWIPKEIIKYLKEKGDFRSCWIVWLEKQGEQKPTLPKWKYKNDNTPLLRDSIILNKYGCVAKSPSGALVSDVWVIDYDELAKLPKEEIEKQGEQKPADKVKQKFKVGDWVVDNAGYIWKIKGILNQFYILEDVGGGESRPTIEWADNTFHLWIIQDAKPGDVLATDKSVFIYAKVLYNKPYAYCGVDKFSVFKDNCLENDWSNSLNNIYPATKEQYNTLMKVMTNAGYTFDFEKKKLKKL